ncbi:MAG TPA: phosphatase PAP2 family protein [Sphingomonadaceae bacterium]|nr:phosphatase PAP2 family protein [Sphingomonadaceae bacterium]
MTGPHEIPDAPPEANAIEQADVAVAKAVAPVVHTPVMKVLGTLSEAADQPPLRALCAGLFALGLWRGDARLARAAARMLLAHSLATGAKTAVKNRVDRTRPTVLVEEGRYEMGAGDSHEHDESSFPSGHTAGAVAAAGSWAQDYPEHRGAAYGLAAAAALMQIPRCKHYPSDVGAGAVLGAAAAAAVNALWPGDQPIAPSNRRYSVSERP